MLVRRLAATVFVAAGMGLLGAPAANARSCPDYVDFYEVRAKGTSCATVKRVQRKLYQRGFGLDEAPLVQVRGKAWRCRFRTTSDGNEVRVRCRNLEGSGSWRSGFSVG